MKKTAKIAAVLLFLGLITFIGWLWLCDDDSQPARPRLTMPTPEAPGGQDLLLEVFGPEGKLLWRVYSRTARMAAEGMLAVTEVRADYAKPGFPASLAADRLDYQPDPNRLVFHGHIRLSGPKLTLTCTELVWDNRSHAFNIGGGYVLTRGDSVMHGERLWASEDFKSVRALGHVRLTTTSTRGDIE